MRGGCNGGCGLRFTNRCTPVAGGTADQPLTRDVHPGPRPVRHGSKYDRGLSLLGVTSPLLLVQPLFAIR